MTKAKCDRCGQDFVLVRFHGDSKAILDHLITNHPPGGSNDPWTGFDVLLVRGEPHPTGQHVAGDRELGLYSCDVAESHEFAKLLQMTELLSAGEINE